jgi:Asp/Glu/hydantoin racemase
MRNDGYGYIGNSEDSDKIFHIPKGQVIAGYTVGILLLDVWYPLLPGNVVNACTYGYPVRHKLVPGATQTRLLHFDPTLVDDLIKAGKELEMEGVRAIVGACGYFAYFQPQLAEALDVPVYLSSLIQVPWIRTGLKSGQKIGVLCADKKSLTSEVLKNAGVTDPEICVISGLGDKPGFSAILQSDRGSFDNELVRNEVVKAAVDLVSDNPDIGAILLECSDMPPYSADVQAAVKLPVYDFITMINWVHQSVAQKPYHGFL